MEQVTWTWWRKQWNLQRTWTFLYLMESLKLHSKYSNLCRIHAHYGCLVFWLGEAGHFPPAPEQYCWVNHGMDHHSPYCPRPWSLPCNNESQDPSIWNLSYLVSQLDIVSWSVQKWCIYPRDPLFLHLQIPLLFYDSRWGKPYFLSQFVQAFHWQVYLWYLGSRVFFQWNVGTRKNSCATGRSRRQTILSFRMPLWTWLTVLLW